MDRTSGLAYYDIDRLYTECVERYFVFAFTNTEISVERATQSDP